MILPVDFGEAFAQRVVDLSPGEWSEPLVSQLGVHLVQVSDRVAGRLPALAEVRAQVEREYLAARRQELKDMAYQNLRAGYEVLIETAANAGNDAAITMGGPRRRHKPQRQKDEAHACCPDRICIAALWWPLDSGICP